MTKEQAVQTAGERLERLEVWMRRCCLAMTACAVLLAVLTAIAVYGASDYVRFKSAVVDVVHEMASGRFSGPPTANR
jgi:hypothetical protein